MSVESISDRDRLFLRFAIEVARGSLIAGNIPIAAVIADDKSFLSLGINSRVQKDSLILHAETSALENVGRAAVPRLKGATMYCTLSPCAMCTGAILLYGIPRIVAADRRTFEGPTNVLRNAGTDVVFVDDEDAYSALYEFRVANPELWDEDNGGQLVAYMSHQLLVVSDLERSLSSYRDLTRLKALRRRDRTCPLQLVAWLGGDQYSLGRDQPPPKIG